MSAMKNRHHFVPQFYLRNFAIDSETNHPRQINIYNLTRDLFILNASIKKQCYHKKLYGDTNEIEEFLATLESDTSPIIKNIILNSSIKNLSPLDLRLLRLFVSSQIQRTLKTIESSQTILNKFCKLILAKNNRPIPNRNFIKFDTQEIAKASLKHCFKMAVIIDDLGLQLIKNYTSYPFITSDNPVFIYNKYCEQTKAAGKTGLLCHGILIFLPICPSLCLLFYDKKTYKLDNKAIDPINIDITTDIAQINALQYIGCHENLYLSHKIKHQCFDSMAQSNNKHRQKTGPKLIEFCDDSDTMHSLTINYNESPNICLNLSFLSLRRKAKRIPIANRLETYRREDPFERIYPSAPDLEEYSQKRFIKSIEL